MLAAILDGVWYRGCAGWVVYASWLDSVFKAVVPMQLVEMPWE